MLLFHEYVQLDSGSKPNLQLTLLDSNVFHETKVLLQNVPKETFFVLKDRSFQDVFALDVGRHLESAGGDLD